MISSQPEMGDGSLAEKQMWSCQGGRCQITHGRKIPESKFRKREEKRIQRKPRGRPIVQGSKNEDSERRKFTKEWKDPSSECWGKVE